jgi:REP element-mobilizing transposase RayT
MPNHFHLLLTIDNSIDQDNTHSVNAVMGWLKYQATTEINRIQATPGKTIFQRSFHDHIIRDEHDYKLRWEYIDTNIDRWIDDDYFTGS